MTSTTIIHGTNAGSRPTLWLLREGDDIVVEGAPGSVAIRNAGVGSCMAVAVDANNTAAGAIQEVAPGQTLNIGVGARYRLTALASCQLQFTWTP